MIVEQTALKDVKLLAPRIFHDERGFFFESYNERIFRELGITDQFVQDNHSRSAKGVLRGLHYQSPGAQGKLVRAIRGRLFDVAVDLRSSSQTFGKWVGYELTDENKKLLWIPAGFAHGFLALTEDAELAYKATNFYAAQSEHCIRWDDPELAIQWPISAKPLLSPKDAQGVFLRDAVLFP